MTAPDQAANAERFAWLETCSPEEHTYLLLWIATGKDEWTNLLFDDAREAVERRRAKAQR